MLSPLLLALYCVMASDVFPTNNVSPSAVVQQWTHLYGTDTVQAARLTTARFRGGKEPDTWGKHLQATLTAIGYQHLRGQIVQETIKNTVATVSLKARIGTRLGVTEQTEVYTLRRVSGQWLIDAVHITNEVAPREGSAVALTINHTRHHPG